MAHYRLRTVSGRQYVWEGNLGELQDRLGDPDVKDNPGFVFLVCPGGTQVNLAYVEAFEPMD